MPEFKDVASHFDDTDLYDAYTDLFLYKGQFNTFDEASRDGSVLRKRVLSLAPGLTIPTRSAITFMGETWLVGEGNAEGFQGLQVRRVFWMKKATDLADLLTPAEACSGAVGVSLVIQREYLKDTTNAYSNAQYYPFWDIALSASEGATIGKFFRIGSKLYRIRSLHRDLSGLFIAGSDELGGIITVILPDAGTFDPITETYSGGSSMIAGILLEVSKLYTLKTDLDPKVHSGDMTLITASQLTVGRNLAIGTEKFQVLTSTPELDAFSHRLRRQG